MRVLHHLDPVAGWRVLRSLLRPGGVMHIGLYSELARRRSLRFRSSLEATKRRRKDCQFRSDLQLVDRWRPFRSLTALEISTTRAAAVISCSTRENRFTLPMINHWLAELELDFLKFNVDSAVEQRYSLQYPGGSRRPISTAGRSSK
jgi:hypothetical protein